MNPDIRRFIDLMRSGMWNVEPDCSLFASGDADWKMIFNLSRSHSVISWVYDGIEMLPSELKPPKGLLMKWFSLVLQVERANRHINSRLVELALLYEKNNIPFVLLKGQGIATAYPNPDHRQPGDIDVYIGPDNYKKANNLLQDNGAVRNHKEDVNDKHCNLNWNGVTVENHIDVAKFAAPEYSKAWKGFFRRSFDGISVKREFSGINVMLPSPYFNSIYLLVHILQHLQTSGIGLRQICDFMTVIRSNSESFNREEWIKDINLLGLDRAYTLFSYIAVKYFGLDRDMFPVYDENKAADADELFEDVVISGNFGREWNNSRLVREPFLKRNFHILLWVLKRYRFARKIYPVEAWHKMLFIIRTGIRHKVELLMSVIGLRK